MENRLVDGAGEEEDVPNGEGSTDMHTLSCVKQVTAGKLPDSTGSPARRSVTTWGRVMGWAGRLSEGISVYLQLIPL